MGYLGVPPQSGFITTAKQRVTSSTSNYVDLDHSISSIADVIVFVNFVKQDTTNLTLTTSTRITLGATLVSSDIVEIHYLGKADRGVAECCAFLVCRDLIAEDSERRGESLGSGQIHDKE